MVGWQAFWADEVYLFFYFMDPARPGHVTQPRAEVHSFPPLNGKMVKLFIWPAHYQRKFCSQSVPGYVSRNWPTLGLGLHSLLQGKNCIYANIIMIIICPFDNTPPCGTNCLSNGLTHSLSDRPTVCLTHCLTDSDPLSDWLWPTACLTHCLSDQLSVWLWPPVCLTRR